MALYLNEDDVHQLLTMPLTLEAVEEAHKELSLARAVDVPRQRTRLPQTALHILQGALPAHDALATRPIPATVPACGFWCMCSAHRRERCGWCCQPTILA